MFPKSFVAHSASVVSQLMRLLDFLHMRLILQLENSVRSRPLDSKHYYSRLHFTSSSLFNNFMISSSVISFSFRGR